jgi:hypothetical protein
MTCKYEYRTTGLPTMKVTNCAYKRTRKYCHFHSLETVYK